MRCEKLASFYVDGERGMEKESKDSSRISMAICCHRKLVNGLMIYPCTVAAKVFTALCSTALDLPDYQVLPTIS